jgi:beta-xylosidase
MARLSAVAEQTVSSAAAVRGSAPLSAVGPDTAGTYCHDGGVAEPAPRRPLARTPRHPVNFPDPFVLHDGPGRWFAYATDDNGCHVQLLTSNDLVTWSGPTEALPVVARWAEANRIWSPAVAPVGGVYVMWYSIHKRGSTRQAISVASSDRPEGPFVDPSDRPMIFVSDEIGSIDPSPFVDVDGRRYLLWRADASSHRRSATLWIQPLREDGLALTDRPHALLGVDARWEGPLIEAPSMLVVDGIYYLFYSANSYNTERYAIGYATSSSVLGPFAKRTTTKPWVGLDDAVWGPGGQEWTTDDDGGLVMAFHGWEPGRAGYKKGGRRRLYVARVDITQGRPVLDRGPGSPGRRRWWPFG